MHALIIQLSLNPIPEDEWIQESDFFDHWFTSAIADYVWPLRESREVRIIQADLPGCKVSADGEGFTLCVKSREQYFEKAHQEFLQQIQVAKEISLEEFAMGNCNIVQANRACNAIWMLQCLYDDKYGNYVSADGEVMTFNQFVRTCCIEKKYYIGNILDYHY